MVFIPKVDKFGRSKAYYDKVKRDTARRTKQRLSRGSGSSGTQRIIEDKARLQREQEAKQKAEQERRSKASATSAKQKAIADALFKQKLFAESERKIAQHAVNIRKLSVRQASERLKRSAIVIQKKVNTELLKRLRKGRSAPTQKKLMIGRNLTETEKANLLRTTDLTIAELDKSIYIKRNGKAFIETPQFSISVKEMGIVTAVKQPKKRQLLERLDKAITDRLNILETQRFRTERGSLKILGIGALTTILSISSAVTSTAKGLRDMPKVIWTLTKNPSLIKQLPKEFSRSFAVSAQSLKVSPTRTMVKIGTEIFLMASLGKALKVVGKASNATVARLSPRFIAIKNEALIVKIPRTGTITMRMATVKSAKTTLAKQLKFAGTTQPLVTTALANRILTLFKPKRMIRKPLPLGIEEQLSPIYKRLLKRFDDKIISLKDFKKLETHLQTKFDKSLLERSLYVDPLGRLRASRLQISDTEKFATLKDLLKGNFRIVGDKPQIIFFRNVVVESFPKTKAFRIIQQKLRSGKALNLDEIVELVRFQTKKSGKFKPIGSTTWAGGIEPELTIAPGELIKRIAKRGFTVIKGKRVSIVEAKVIKGSKNLNKLLDDFKLKKLSKSDLAKLKKLYKKETKVKFDLRQARNQIRRPLFRPKISTKLSRLSAIARRKRLKKALRKVTPRRITRKVTRARTITRKAPKRITTTRAPTRITPTRLRPPRGRAPRGRAPLRPIRPGRPIPKTPLLRFRLKRKKLEYRTLANPVPVYKVFGKIRGKKRLLMKDLTKSDAKNFLAYEVDNQLMRTISFKATGKRKRVVRLPSKYSGQFSKVKHKLRPFKTRKKKKLRISGYIERKKYIGDTKGEQVQLRLARKRKSKKKTIKKKKVIKRKFGKRKTKKKKK